MLIRCTAFLPASSLPPSFCSFLPSFLPSFLSSFLLSTSAPIASYRRNKTRSPGAGLAHSFSRRTGVCDMKSLFEPRAGRTHLLVMLTTSRSNSRARSTTCVSSVSLSLSACALPKGRQAAAAFTGSSFQTFRSMRQAKWRRHD